jgi:hypothetical protein
MGSPLRKMVSIEIHLAIAENYISVKQESDAVRRDQCDILDHHTLIDNVLRGRGGPQKQNDYRGHYPPIAQGHPWHLQNLSIGRLARIYPAAAT